MASHLKEEEEGAGLKVLFLVRIQLCWHIVSILWHGTNVSPWRWVIGVWVVSSSIFILFQNLTIKFSVLLGIYIYLNYQDFSRKISAIEFFPINTSVTSIFFTKSRGIAGRRFFSLAQFFILCLPILWWNKMAAHQNDIKKSRPITSRLRKQQTNLCAVLLDMVPKIDFGPSSS